MTGLEKVNELRVYVLKLYFVVIFDILYLHMCRLLHESEIINRFFPCKIQVCRLVVCFKGSPPSRQFFCLRRSVFRKHPSQNPTQIKQDVSNEKILGCLGYIGDYTAQLYRD